MTPLPAPTISPTGPFKLSTQPGTGSSHAGVTAEKKKETNNNYNLSITMYQHVFLIFSFFFL